MTNSQIAAALSEIGTLLELQGETGFRANAYHSAARSVDNLGDEVEARVRAGQLGSIPGIGSTLREKIETLVLTGSIPQLEELRASTPVGLVQMLRVPGLGPKKVRALADSGIDDLAKLKQACDEGRVAKIKGFGAKTQENITNGLAFLDKAGGRIRIDTADQLAGPIVALLRKVPGVTRAEACGSLRRRKETVGDLDFLVAAAEPGPAMDAFAALPGVADVIARGDTLTSVLLPVGHGPRATTIRADLRVVSAEQFPYALHHLTGSKEHNKAMRGRAQDRGMKMNEYGLTGATCTSEAEIFPALDLEYIPPELREDAGEIAAAESKSLPKLIELSDLRGAFHNHTTASDGAATLLQMAEAAQELGFQYLGIADHSQSLQVARGLSPERVRAQREEIDALNAEFEDFRLFHGIECDILPDGSLDYDDDILASFDYVVASVHTHFNQSREEVTARVVKAIRHPSVTMLGHATGRLILQREGYPVDLDAVLKAAAEAGTMIEINAQPKRLELDWVHARRAKELGIPIVINPDAHATDEIALVSYGIDVARRAWLTKDDVFNTKTRRQVEAVLRV
jgi:DNA polymerase (family 10)